jgi:hypothetical protein
VPLPAFLAQPHPEPPVLRNDILDRHTERRADPGEGIDHEPDQRAIAQADDTRRVDAIEQCARLGGIEHGRLPGRHDVPRPAHRCSGVDRHDLAGNEPVEQMTDRGNPLLHAWRREFARHSPDPGRDVYQLHGADRGHAGARAPSQEFICS